MDRQGAGVTLYPEAKRRVPWLNKEEVSRLLNALPPHQRQLARFALATGLRQANVLGLQWSEIDRMMSWSHRAVFPFRRARPSSGSHQESRKRCASRAAMQPVPALVTAWR